MASKIDITPLPQFDLLGKQSSVLEKLDETFSNICGSIRYKRRQAKTSLNFFYQVGKTTQEIF